MYYIIIKGVQKCKTRIKRVFPKEPMRMVVRKGNKMLTQLFSEKWHFEIKGNFKKNTPIAIIDRTRDTTILVDKRDFSELLDTMQTFKRESV